MWQKSKNTVIQKADEGNMFVILEKCSSVIEEILNDYAKFCKLNIHAGKEINHIIDLQNRIL